MIVSASIKCIAGFVQYKEFKDSERLHVHKESLHTRTPKTSHWWLILSVLPPITLLKKEYTINFVPVMILDRMLEICWGWMMKRRSINGYNEELKLGISD